MFECAVYDGFVTVIAARSLPLCQHGPPFPRRSVILLSLSPIYFAVIRKRTTVTGCTIMKTSFKGYQPKAGTTFN